jgi:hypothetical protein
MIIIETCPKCGHDLTDLVLATYPPIPQKKCFGCGWEWTCEREEIVRVPFGGNNLNVDDFNGSNLNLSTFDELSKSLIRDNFEQPACVNCPSNPKNGGSGICFCILGQAQITC